MSEKEKQAPEITAGPEGKITFEDKIVRIIGIPFFGLVIPNATGLLLPGKPSLLMLMTEYIFFVGVAGIIWEGNRYLFFRNYPVILKSHTLFQKYILMTGLNIFYSAPVSFTLLYCWEKLMTGAVTLDKILLTVAVIVVCVIFVTNIYEKALFSRHSDNEKYRIEQLERLKIQAEVEALKNQIDPHFFFNALNSLSYLIDNNPARASQYVKDLADVYRYILSSKDKDLVPLQDELIFLESYVALVKIRYEEGFSVRVMIPDAEIKNYLIPPIALMVAVENAVKHNIISSHQKLELEVIFQRGYIEVSNRILLRKPLHDSTRTGLKNLNGRFEKIMGSGIKTISREGIFTLQMPVFKL